MSDNAKQKGRRLLDITLKLAVMFATVALLANAFGGLIISADHDARSSQSAYATLARVRAHKVQPEERMPRQDAG